MRGNSIIVTAQNKGQKLEGYVKTANTFYPGMVVQRDPSVALIGGLHTYKVYDRDADGDQPRGAFWVVTELVGVYWGRDATQSYAAGEICSLYAPLPGDELNLIVENLSGTADDHALDEILMVNDGTGKLVATTGTPETEVAQLLEAITDPTADTLAWCQWTGH